MTAPTWQCPRCTVRYHIVTDAPQQAEPTQCTECPLRHWSGKVRARSTPKRQDVIRCYALAQDIAAFGPMTRAPAR